MGHHTQAALVFIGATAFCFCIAMIAISIISELTTEQWDKLRRFFGGGE